MGKIRMVVLTESSKFHNNCVAGIEVNSGKWVRLVSDDDTIHGAIRDADITYANGEKCKILDVIGVECIKPLLTDTQPENMLMNSRVQITYEGELSIKDVIEKHGIERKNTLFGNTYNYVYEANMLGIGYSLTLIETRNLRFSWQENDHGYLKLKVDFDCNGVRYTNMSVTDPEYYGVKENDHIVHAYMVISIGTPYYERCYKFVAKIFQ